MTINLLQLLSFLISLWAFVRGVIVVSRKDGPMYFQIVAGTAVCHLLKEASMLITHFCDHPSDNLVVVTLATISSVFFLLSANFGQLDGIVDDGSAPVWIKLAACFVPLLILCSFVAMLAAGLSGNTVQVIADAATVALMLPASYFSAKHLLLPDDEVGFLRSSRGCNLCALLYYVTLRLDAFVEAAGAQSTLGAMHILVSVVVFILVLTAERGIKRWKILISSFS